MDIRNGTSWQALGRKMLAPVLLAGLTVGSMTAAVLAQDATPEATPQAEAAISRPAHIHTGTCDAVGEVIQPLVDLTAPAGDAVGQAAATVAESSFTNVPMALADIVAADHVVNVHTSADQIDVYIACGEVGGVLDANGALVIGLGEYEGSGFTGIAYLAPGADGVSTDVSVFVAETE